jgi:hypothetical protein
MQQFIAHIFPSKSKRTRHLNDVFCHDLAVEVNKTASLYVGLDGSCHRCFVVQAREDVTDFLGWEFASSEIHGPGEYALSTEDYGYMCAMLRQRTRQVPEAANG